jgi:hypothetical protein
VAELTGTSESAPSVVERYRRTAIDVDGHRIELSISRGVDFFLAAPAVTAIR